MFHKWDERLIFYIFFIMAITISVSSASDTGFQCMKAHNAVSLWVKMKLFNQIQRNQNMPLQRSCTFPRLYLVDTDGVWPF